MQTTLRGAVPSDLDILDAFSEAYHRFEGLPTPPEIRRGALAALLADPTLGRLYLVRCETADSTADVGFAALAFGFSIELGGRDAFLDELFLVEGSRGRGIGAEVLELLSAEARKLDLAALHLLVDQRNERAVRLYRSRGFVERSGFRMMTLELGRTSPRSPEPK